MINTHIKICGITNLDDALVAAHSGADLLGFIFYSKSPRAVEPDVAAKIIAGIQEEFSLGSDPQPGGPHTVGVFVDESLEYIQRIQSKARFDYAQLHGDEQPEMLQQMNGQAYKVLRPSSQDEATSQAASYARLGIKDGPGWLIDAYDPNAYGGTGHKTDWRTAARLAHQYPGLLLAGGLTPENVVQAIETVQPWGVDVASGVEAVPGKKDHEKVRKFIQRVKEL
ncbi:MAG: phosphoribosylanthranilate isomerase [Chloroflexota bacterium]